MKAKREDRGANGGDHAVREPRIRRFAGDRSVWTYSFRACDRGRPGPIVQTQYRRCVSVCNRTHALSDVTFALGAGAPRFSGKADIPK